MSSNENPTDPNLRVFLIAVDYLGDNIGDDWVFEFAFDRSAPVRVPLKVSHGRTTRLRREVHDVGRPPSVDGSTTALITTITAREVDPVFDESGSGNGLVSTQRFIRQRIGVVVTADGGDEPRSARLVFTFIVVASPDLDDAVDEGGNVLIIDPTRPTQTTERFRCSREVVQRRTTIRPHVRFVPTDSRLIATATVTGEAELRLALEAALSNKTTASFGATLGAASLTNETTLEAKVSAAFEFIGRAKLTLLVHTFRVRGRLERYKVAEVRQLLQWVGPDCEAIGMPPNPQVETSLIEGERVSEDVDEIFLIYEAAPATGAQGADVIATTELREALRTFLEGQDLSDVKDPENLPMPLDLD